jgi:hypothetical protein
MSLRYAFKTQYINPLPHRLPAGNQAMKSLINVRINWRQYNTSSTLIISIRKLISQQPSFFFFLNIRMVPNPTISDIKLKRTDKYYTCSKPKGFENN